MTKVAAATLLPLGFFFLLLIKLSMKMVLNGVSVYGGAVEPKQAKNSADRKKLTF